VLSIASTANVGTKSMLAGTPGFQSPEQLKLENIDERADIFSLGGMWQRCLESILSGKATHIIKLCTSSQWRGFIHPSVTSLLKCKKFARAASLKR